MTTDTLPTRTRTVVRRPATHGRPGRRSRQADRSRREMGTVRTSNRRRWVTAAVGLGTPAAALATAAMIGMGHAPVANADPISQIIGDVGIEIGQGNAEFPVAGTDFAAGHLAQGVADIFGGADAYLLGVPDSVIIGGIQALTGEPVNATLPFGGIGAPVDLSMFVTEVDNYLGGGVQALYQSLVDLFDLNLGLAADYALYGLDNVAVELPEFIGVSLLSLL